MDTRTLIFDIQRTDDADWLTHLREDVDDELHYSDEDKAEIHDAINMRFSQLNLLALAKRKTTEGN